MNAKVVRAITIALSVLVGLAVGIVVGRATSSTTTSTSTTSTSTTSTSTSTSVPNTTTLPLAQPTTALYPFAAMNVRFDDPRAAAQAFATNYLRFSNPITGKFQAGDNQSGEVPVTTRVGGPVTTVLVRKFGTPETWWVLGASTSNIAVTAPSPMAEIASPVSLAGISTAYEAVVNVELYRDGSLTPVATTTVMGGSMGAMGPFASNFSFASGGAGRGALVFHTLSAKDGSVVEASTVRVAFTH